MENTAKNHCYFASAKFQNESYHYIVHICQRREKSKWTLMLHWAEFDV